MKKLNFNFLLVGLDGIEIPKENANVAKVLGNALATDTKGDALKKWSLATRIYSEEDFEIDEADFQMLKSFIEHNEQFTVLFKAQLVNHLNCAK